MKVLPLSLRLLLSSSLLFVSLTLKASEPAQTLFTSNRSVAVPASERLHPATESARKNFSETYGKLPLSFEPNQGQHDADIRFLSQGGNYNFSLRSAGATLVLGDISLNVTFKGANPNPHIEGLDELPGKTNYLIGNDRQQWRTGIPTFAKVRYHNLWPGIDLIWYGQQQQLEYDFIVAPGADLNAIRLEFSGVEKLRVDKNGDLALRTANGDIRQRRPVVYQESRNGKRMLKGSYVVSGNRQVHFRVSRYDLALPLVIDPQVAYIASLPTANDLAVDSQGNVYLLYSQGIMKINATGTAILFNSILGERYSTDARKVALDSSGNLHIAFNTRRSTLPATDGSRASKGLARSADGGTTWNTLEDFDEFHLDSTNPLVIYTGKDGVLSRSDNGGDTWTSLNQHFTAIAACNESTVYGIQKNENGLFKSTDGGRSFQSSGLSDERIETLIIDHRNTSVLYAGITKSSSFSKVGGIFKSTDAGKTWDAINNGLPTDNLSYIIQQSRNNSQILYAVASYIGNYSNAQGVYRTSDGGATWKPVQTGLPFTNENDYAGFRISSLEIDPVNADTVYLATKFGIYKTTNSGSDWKQIWIDKYWVHNLAISPNTPSTIYATPFYTKGLFRSDDSGSTWKLMENVFQDVRLPTLKINPTQPTTFYTIVEPNQDVYLMKLSQDGQTLRSAGYFGTPQEESSVGLAVDGNGNAILAYHQNLQGVVTKLTPNGVRDFYLRLPVFISDIALGLDGRAYVTGAVSDDLFSRISINGFQSAPRGKSDAFILGIDTRQYPDKSLFYATYLGGSESESGTLLALGFDGSIFVAGRTFSTDFPLSPNALQKVKVDFNSSIFLTHLDPVKSGQPSLMYSTFLGGKDEWSISDLAVDATGNAYLSGYTISLAYPTTPGSYQPIAAGGAITYPPQCVPSPICSCSLASRPPYCPFITPLPTPTNDGFVSIVTPDGSTLLYSTYFGVIDKHDKITSLAVDTLGNFLFAGNGTVRPFNNNLTRSLEDGFLVKLTPDPIPRNTVAATVSAATYRGLQLAPESIVASFVDAFGTGSGNLNATVTDSTGTERSAYMFYSGPGQVNFQVPPGTATGNGTVRINSNNAAIATTAVQIVDVAPGIFSADASGTGLAAAVALRFKPGDTGNYELVVRYDSTLKKFVSIPIDFGPDLGGNSDEMYLALFGTGFRFRSAESNVKVTIGSIEVPVIYAGSQRQLIGLDQINVRLPRTLIGKGETDIVVTVDGKTANTVRVSFK